MSFGMSDLILIVSFSSFVFVLFLIYLVYRLVDTVKKVENRIIESSQKMTLDDEIQHIFAKRNIYITNYQVAKKKDSKDIYTWSVTGKDATKTDEK